MLTLRLSEGLQRSIDRVAQRHGLPRSTWLRQLIEREVAREDQRPDPHELYLRLMAKRPPPPANAPRTNHAANHSDVLKVMLRAADRRR